MSNDELFRAMGLFNQGLQSYAISSALKDATSQVNQLNAQALKDTEKNTQLQALGNQLALQLGGMGAPVSQIQSAVGAILPQQDATIQQGLLSPYAPNQQRAKEALNMQQQSETQQLAQRERIQANAEDRQFGRQLKLMEARQIAKIGEKKPLKAGDISFATNIDMGMKLADELETTVKKDGTWESAWFGNSSSAAALEGIPYQLAITYAKIVDPDSVAREGEVAAAQKYLIELGPTSNRKTVLEQIKRLKTTIKDYSKARVKQIAAPDYNAQPEQQQQQSAPQPLDVSSYLE